MLAVKEKNITNCVESIIQLFIYREAENKTCGEWLETLHGGCHPIATGLMTLLQMPEHLQFLPTSVSKTILVLRRDGLNVRL